MSQQQMSKKLKQAVEYANNTNPKSRTTHQPSSSKKEKEKF